MNFGISPHFAAYPGTISLKINTYLLVVEDLVRSVYAQGFRRLVVLNGHGGNTPAATRLVELCNELPDLNIAWYAWWTAASVTAAAERHALKSYHAAWIEAFPFARVAELPEGSKTAVVARPVQNAAQYRQHFGDGVFGGPYQVKRRSWMKFSPPHCRMCCNCCALRPDFTSNLQAGYMAVMRRR